MVFYGEYDVSFSGVGRIIIPKKIRELLKGNTFILTKGFDFCLAGYDQEDWEARSAALLQVPLLEKNQIERRRFVFASTVYVDIDTQGRFVIPKNLLEFGKFDKSATIVGAGDHFEIWHPAQWKVYLQKIKVEENPQ